MSAVGAELDPLAAAAASWFAHREATPLCVRLEGDKGDEDPDPPEQERAETTVTTSITVIEISFMVSRARVALILENRAENAIT